jgi:transcriptional regulator with XRE-family HTH domain
VSFVHARPHSELLEYESTERIEENMSAAVAKRLASIRDRGGIKSRDIAQLLDTTPETVSRWQNGKSDPQQDRLERLLTLEWIVEELNAFYEPEESRMWLFKPHTLLNGDSPAQRLQQGRVEDVKALISQLKDGAFA